MKNWKSLFFICLVILFLFGCGKNSEVSKKFPGIDLPLSQFNSEVAIIEDPGTQGPYKNGEMLFFIIENRSSQEYIFSNDMGVKIFQEQNGSWVTIENPVFYTEESKYLLTQDEYPAGLTLVVTPYIPDLVEPTIIRIAIQGQYAEKPGKLVGAYIDIQLNP
jgi:hypothetical protein